jgi:hypothetical protein
VFFHQPFKFITEFIDGGAIHSDHNHIGETL